MTFERARVLADAVLLEGYVLYPYRASAPKNRYRWAFGILAPRSWSENGGCEAWWMESQCLVEVGDRTVITARFRCLQSQHRQVSRAMEANGAHFEPVESLDAAGQLHVTWDEGVIREFDVVIDLAAARDGKHRVVPIEIAAGTDVEPIINGDQRIVGRLTREREAISAQMRIRVEPIAGARPLARVHIRVENDTPCADANARREAILPKALLSSHLLLSVEHGAFVSLLDPPDYAASAARECKNVRTYPVLVGSEHQRDLLLSAPIILYDHALVAPESLGDFFDATEIDELLALRTSTLTEEEKRHARATDVRSAALVDRVEQMHPDTMAQLHGAVRETGRGAMVPRQRPNSKAPPVGSRVRLRPGARRTDAQDLLYAGLIATVEQVLEDVDGNEFVAVTIDDDPAADMHRWYGRFLQYYVDEVELISSREEVAS